jgi:Rod binding domain-containing protein
MPILRLSSQRRLHERDHRHEPARAGFDAEPAGSLRDLRSQVQPEKGMDEAKLKKACQDFEAVFIGQIWKQMRASVPKEGMLHSKEEESYLSMFDQELSVKMARSGGIGLSDMLYANLSERLVNASRDTARRALAAPGPPAAGKIQPQPGRGVQPRTLAASRPSTRRRCWPGASSSRIPGGQDKVGACPPIWMTPCGSCAWTARMICRLSGPGEILAGSAPPPARVGREGTLKRSR